MRLETLHSFDQSDQSQHKKAKRQRPKRDFDIVVSGQFHTLSDVSFDNCVNEEFSSGAAVGT